MALTWNNDWESLADGDFIGSMADGSAWMMFWAAYGERLAAASGTILRDYGDDHTYDGLRPLNCAGTAETGWQWLALRILGLRTYFLRLFEDDGVTPWTPVGQSYILSWGERTDYPTYHANPIPFPGPNGLRRKYRREIWRLDYPGTAGQRARFTSLQYNFFRSAKCGYYDGVAGTDFNSVVSTASDQRKYSGALFDHDGSGWVVSADQITPADVVLDYGLPVAGDLFGGWFLNDLRDAINLLTTTIAATTYAVNITPTRATAAWNSRSELNDKYVVAYDPAAVDAAWASATPTNSSGPPLKFCDVGSLGSSRAYSMYSYIDVVGAPNPSALNRDVSFLLRPSVRTSPADAYRIYSDFGTGLTQDVWQAIGTPLSGTASVDISGPMVLELNQPLPWDHAHRPELYAANAAVVFKWDVAGGFVYSSST